MVTEVLPHGDPWGDRRGTWQFISTCKDRLAITCPGCGMFVALMNHSVDEDGIVDPIFICIAPACDWIGRIKLVDWRKRRHG